MPTPASRPRCSRYYYNNVTGSVILLEVMAEFNVKNIVFSSSATVYGNVTPEQMPLKESHPLSAISPYGRTKASEGARQQGR